MNQRKSIPVAMLALVLAGSPVVAQEARQGPEMDVVFVLDTTGSMSALIQTAKEKIWAMANEILRGKPRPRLRIGLVAYRDRRDAYVTRTFALTSDLDQVFRNLMGFKAEGGGDTREHVNKALHDAVHTLAWTEAKGAVKIIFLVGDAPPHMDYDDGFDYRKSASQAIGKGIMVNTLRIGAITGTEAVWQEIARLADGSYREIRIDPARAAAVVKTEYDDRLEALRRKLGGGRPGAPGKAAGARVYLAHRLTKSKDRKGDLIDDIIAGRIKVDAVPESRLPAELKKLAGPARVKKLQALMGERKKLLAELESLEARRSAAVDKKLKERARKARVGDDGFDRAVVDEVKKAAGKAGIKYEDGK